MSIKVNSGFDIGSISPIDSRIELTIAEMKAINENTQPDVYFAICKDNGNLYLYNKENSVDETTGKFRKIDSDIETYVKENAEKADYTGNTAKFYAQAPSKGRDEAYIIPDDVETAYYETNVDMPSTYSPDTFTYEWTSFDTSEDYEVNDAYYVASTRSFWKARTTTKTYLMYDYAITTTIKSKLSEIDLKLDTTNIVTYPISVEPTDSNVLSAKATTTMFTSMGSQIPDVIDYPITEEPTDDNTISAKGILTLATEIGNAMPDIVTSWSDEPLDTNVPSEKLIKSTMGAANGIATLDSNGKLVSDQLPTSARQIKGQLDASTTHELPDASGYNAGDEFIVVSSGYYTQSTAFTLTAGNTLTEMEVSQANTLIAAGYVFTLTSGETTLGTVSTFATDKVTFTDETSIDLPYSTDLSATSTPSVVQITVAVGDEIINIDSHWIKLSNTSNVSSVNSKTGAVVLSASDVSAVSTSDIVSEFEETTSDTKVPSEKLVKDNLDEKVNTASTSDISISHTNTDTTKNSKIELSDSSINFTSQKIALDYSEKDNHLEIDATEISDVKISNDGNLEIQPSSELHLLSSDGTQIKSESEVKIKSYIDSEYESGISIDDEGITLDGSKVTIPNSTDTYNNLVISQEDVNSKANTKIEATNTKLIWDNDDNFFIYNENSDEAKITLGAEGDITINACSSCDEDSYTKISMTNTKINIDANKGDTSGTINLNANSVKVNGVEIGGSSKPFGCIGTAFEYIPDSNIVPYACTNGVYVNGNETSGYVAYSEDGRTWTDTSITNSGSTIIDSSLGVFVYNSSLKQLYFTEDGKTYTLLASDFELNSTVQGYGHIESNNKYYFICKDTDNSYLCSTDGKTINKIDFTILAIPSSTGVLLFSCGKYLYIYDQTTGTVRYTSDGTTLTKLFDGLHYFRYANGKYFCSGTSKSGLWYSNDGINFTQSNITSSSLVGSYVIDYGNGVYVAYIPSNSSCKGVYYSYDGITWTFVSLSGMLTWCYTSIYLGGLFIVRAINSSNEYEIKYSYNGVNWNTATIHSSQTVTAMIVDYIYYANGVYVKDSRYASKDAPLYSLNGIDWYDIKCPRPAGDGYCYIWKTRNNNFSGWFMLSSSERKVFISDELAMKNLGIIS